MAIMSSIDSEILHRGACMVATVLKYLPIAIQTYNLLCMKGE